MGDHTESIEIDFHSEIISYDELLNVFWENHNPLSNSFYKDRQYMSLLLYHNDDQKERAQKTMEKWEHSLKGEIQTEIAPYSTFYVAEDYHQKYYLKRYAKAIEQVKKIIPDHKDFVNSTIAARLNGFVAGHGSLNDLKEEMEEWRLSAEELENLIKLLNEIKW